MKYDDIDKPVEMRSLAHTALELTRLGEIQWAVTDDPDCFLYSGVKSGLMIDGEPMPEPDVGAYTLTLVNSKGDTVAEFSNESEDPPGQRTEILSDLWYAARNNALEVEDTFKDIRQALGISPKE